MQDAPSHFSLLFRSKNIWHIPQCAIIHTIKIYVHTNKTLTVNHTTYNWQRYRWLTRPRQYRSKELKIMGYLVILVKEQTTKPLCWHLLGFWSQQPLWILQEASNIAISQRHQKNISTRQSKLRSITIFVLHYVTHASRVCWEETICPMFYDAIVTG